MGSSYEYSGMMEDLDAYWLTPVIDVYNEEPPPPPRHAPKEMEIDSEDDYEAEEEPSGPALLDIQNAIKQVGLPAWSDEWRQEPKEEHNLILIKSTLNPKVSEFIPKDLKCNENDKGPEEQQENIENKASEILGQEKSHEACEDVIEKVVEKANDKKSVWSLNVEKLEKERRRTKHPRKSNVAMTSLSELLSAFKPTKKLWRPEDFMPAVGASQASPDVPSTSVAPLPPPFPLLSTPATPSLPTVLAPPAISSLPKHSAPLAISSLPTVSAPLTISSLPTASAPLAISSPPNPPAPPAVVDPPAEIIAESREKVQSWLSNGPKKMNARKVTAELSLERPLEFVPKSNLASREDNASSSRATVSKISVPSKENHSHSPASSNVSKRSKVFVSSSKSDAFYEKYSKAKKEEEERKNSQIPVQNTISGYIVVQLQEKKKRDELMLSPSSTEDNLHLNC